MRRNPIKYFVFNKQSDFARGSYYNIRLLPVGIEILNPQEGAGTFYSRLLDAREKQMKWHRILVEGDTVSEASVRFWIYASESRTFYWKEQQRDIGEVLEDNKIPQQEKQKMLESYCVKIADNPKDILIHEVQGRYVWLRIQLISQGTESPNITKIKIIFPKNSWLMYLPDIYQEDIQSASFVERYLGMFQSLYQDMTGKIQEVSAYFDPDAAKGPFMEWLAEWISIEDTYIWNEQQLAYLVKNGMELYKKRGTVEYMKEMIKLYTGSISYIVEYHQIEPYLNRSGYAEKLQELYGENSYIFTVIVDRNEKINQKNYHILNKIIERSKPAHMEGHIIVLEPYLFLDKHSYLGINSVLGSYGELVLNGQTSIPFARLGESEEEKQSEKFKIF